MFFTFLSIQAIAMVVSISLKPGTNSYARAYFVSTPILWVASILIIYELYANVLAEFPGILSLGKWVMAGSVALAVGISGLTAWFDWNVLANQEFPIVFYYTFTDRGIKTAQVVFLLAMTVFMRWFPAPLRRNVHVHTVILFLYFLIQSSSLLVRNLAGAQVTMLVNLVILSASCLCMLGWIWQLSPELADRDVTYRRVDQEEERRILAGMRAVNDTLLGLGKR